MKPEFTAKQMDNAINKAWIAAREEALEEAAKIAEAELCGRGEITLDTPAMDIYEDHCLAVHEVGNKIRALKGSEIKWKCPSCKHSPKEETQDPFCQTGGCKCVCGG